MLPRALDLSQRQPKIGPVKRCNPGISIAAVLLSVLVAELPSAMASTSAKRLGALLKQPSYRKADFSIHFLDLATDKTVFALHPDESLVPASNMKLVTTAAALDLLGADFTYETTFALLDDDLVIIASGDSLIGDPCLAEGFGREVSGIFDALAEKLKRRGISTINGKLLIDTTIFDIQQFHPSWPVKQANRPYVAEVSALNFNNNCVDLTLTATAAAKPVAVAVSPATSYVTITNKCLTATAGNNSGWAARAARSNNLTLRGKCRNSQTFSVTIHQPTAFFGHLLTERLLAHSIVIKDKQLVVKRLRDAAGRPPGRLDVLYVHRTGIDQVLTRANRDSLGLATECLLKTCGAYYDLPDGTVCAEGSWGSGRAAIGTFLSKLGIRPGQYHIDDGSGLSRQNRLSARCLTTVLAYTAGQSTAELFRSSLATPTSGTLGRRRRFAERPYRDRIWAKTGYIAGVRCLSGYCLTKSGRQLAFAIVSTAQSTSMVDRIVKEAVR